MTPRTIKTFSCHALKLVPLSIGIEFMLAEIFAAEFETGQRTKQTKQTNSHKHHIMQTINSNNGRAHHKIPSTILIFSLWTKILTYK